MSTNKRSALVLGGSGAVGRELIQTLLDSEAFQKIHVPLRKEINFQNKKVITHAFSDVYRPWEFQKSITDLFYCLGTTLKKAGGKTSFEETEVALARHTLLLAKTLEVKNLYIVSAQGVDPHSHFHYLKVKSEVEKILTDHCFKSIYIYRPSLLLTPREEFRLGELVAQKVFTPVAPTLQKAFPSRAPVFVRQLAKALAFDATHLSEGLQIRENKQIIEQSLLS